MGYSREQVIEMLTELTDYFAWMHGQTRSLNIDVPEVAIASWVTVLCDISEYEIGIAKKMVVDSFKWMPTPHEFLELIAGSDDADALQNWLTILQALRLSASDRPAILDDLPAYAKLALQSCGGSQLLSEAKVESLHSTIKNQFISAWKAFKKSSRWRDDKHMQKIIEPMKKEDKILPEGEAEEIVIDMELNKKMINASLQELLLKKSLAAAEQKPL